MVFSLKVPSVEHIFMLADDPLCFPEQRDLTKSNFQFHIGFARQESFCTAFATELIFACKMKNVNKLHGSMKNLMNL